MKKLIALFAMITCLTQFGLAQQKHDLMFDSADMPKDFIRPNQVMIIAAPAKTKRWVKEIDEAFAGFKGKYEISDLKDVSAFGQDKVDDQYPDKTKYPYLLVFTQQWGANDLPDGVSAILLDRRNKKIVVFGRGKTTTKTVEFVAEKLIPIAARMN